MRKFTLSAFVAATLLLSSLTSMGQTAGALNFDGADDYVTLGDPSSMQFASSGAFSVQLWMNPLNTNGGWHTIIDKTLWGWGSEGTGILLYINEGTLYLSTPTWSTNDGILFSTPVTANTWTHVAFSYNNGTWNMYINGQALGAPVTGKNYTNSTTGWMIGMRNNNDGDGPTDPTALSVDEVRIWNRALTGDEISGSMSCELGSGVSGLVAYYRFNQGSAGASNTSVTTVTDNSGNGNTGTLHNFALTGSSSNWIGGYVSGSCGTGSRKVNICHKGKTLSVDSNALSGHLGHGDYVGTCGAKRSSDDNEEEEESVLTEAAATTIRIYPNPSEGVFSVAIPVTHKEAQVWVSDIAGRVIDNKVITDNDGKAVVFNLGNTAKGIYIVKVAAGDESFISKLIVR